LTISEILYEYESRRPNMKGDYAGGMTEGELESIREESAALREHLRKIRNDTETPQG